MKIELPDRVKLILDILGQHGFEGYAVGGCVRDCLLHKTPKDWDITTNASPEEVKEIFNKTIDTGIEHGTVTVMLGGEGFEVTTYRIDGKYEDNRHPSEVVFTRNLSDDLLRRDFTINAMAYNEESGLVDLFNGEDDLKNGIIRAVGDPIKRFSEDALRMMRAVRFASVLGFEIENETFEAIKELAPNLASVSAERIREELFKLVCGAYPEKIHLAYQSGITKVVLPEWDACEECAQKNVHHIFNVADHTIEAIKGIQSMTGMRAPWNAAGGRIPVWTDFSDKEKQILCVSMLLHDIAKPVVKTTKGGVDHFSNHQEKSSELAVDILHRLKCDNDTIHYVKILTLHHDDRFKADWSAGSPAARRLANKIGTDAFRLLVLIQYADALAQSPMSLAGNLDTIDLMRDRLDEIFENEECVNVKQLKVNGRDLIELGAKPGPGLGEILDTLLEEVLEKPELNDRDYLINKAKKLIEG